MVTKWAFLFPGQGAQYSGMGKDFFDAFSVAREIFESADDYLKFPFSQLIFEGPSTELTLTKNSQVAIFITSMAILRVVQQEFPHLCPSVCAGLSLGEYTALTAAGNISFKDCLELVYWRARYMHEACEREKGSMQVILGLDGDLVESVIKEVRACYPVWVANLNCPGQVVIAGTESGLQAAVESLKQKGAKRALPLEVSGAFHSGLMRSAQEQLTPKIQSVQLAASDIPVVMNVPGGYVQSIDEMRQCLINQVTGSVRWEQGIRAIEQQGIEAYIEMGPGKTLSSMNKRIGVAGSTYSIEKAEDLLQLKGVVCQC